MPNLFGTDGIVNHLTLIFAAVYVLGALLFRKNVANDLMGYPFSVIGSSALSILLFTILNIFIENFKIPLAISLIGFFVGGFLLAPLIGDGESEN